MAADEEKGMMIMLAGLMSADDIVDKLEDAITSYKAAKLIGNPADDVKDKLHKIRFTSTLLLTNLITGGTADGTMDLMSKMKLMKEFREKTEGDKKD